MQYSIQYKVFAISVSQLFSSEIKTYLMEEDSFPLFLQLILNYGNIILAFSCDLNNTSKQYIWEEVATLRCGVVWCGVVWCAVLQICMKRQLNFNRKTLTCAFPSPTCSTTVAKMPYVMNDCQIVFMLIQIRYPLLKCYTVVELVGVWEIHWRVWCVSTMIYRHFQSSMHTFRFSCDLRCTS